MKTLTLRQSRERSLPYCYVWQQANQVNTLGFFDKIKTLLFINYGLNTKTQAWYDRDELQEIIEYIGTNANDNAYFDRVKKEFWQQWNELIPYVNGHKQPKNLRELKQFYQNWIRWWAPMAVIFVLPESTMARPGIKEEALEIRTKTEKYSDQGDKNFLKMLIKLKPEYTGIAHLMTPVEIFHHHSLSSLTEEQRQIQIQQIKERIKARENGFVLFNGKLYPLEELHDILRDNNLKLEQNDVSGLSEVTGSVAHHGQARGRVIIISSKSQFKRVKEGDILITEMTSPDYVSVMGKVAAIVTDEGGITSHAAIISRELGIPCLVGTQFATKVFRDGDLVEVDAEKGVVRKL